MENLILEDHDKFVRLSNVREVQLMAITKRLACLLANQIGVLAVSGEVGAGKSTFCRHLLRALGYSGNVVSPTYLGVETYQWNQYLVHHFDFYKERMGAEKDEVLQELIDDSALCLVEWPECAVRYRLPTFLQISLFLSTTSPLQRDLCFIGNTSSWQGASLINKLQGI